MNDVDSLTEASAFDAKSLAGFGHFGVAYSLPKDWREHQSKELRSSITGPAVRTSLRLLAFLSSSLWRFPFGRPRRLSVDRSSRFGHFLGTKPQRWQPESS